MKRRKFIAFLGLTGILVCVTGFIVVVLFLQTPNAHKKIAAWMMHADYLGSEGVLLQTKRNNCGPSALKMVFDHYNISSSLKEIEQCVKLTEKGSSMLALKEMAELKGLKAEGWRFTLEDFLRSSFPSILYVNKDHYIVADSVSVDGNIYICDPTIGRLRISKEKLNKIWGGETLVFKKK
jgi:ABC-type bacteriocin/lantibiotic exporter with double-glycine peptidase domain